MCYRPWHGEGLPEYPPDWVEAIQSVAGSADGPYLDLPVYLTSEAALSEPLQAMVAAGFSLPTESASPPTETISMIKPACAGVTVSMTIMGQPNVAVGFVDTTETTKYPIELAVVESSSGSFGVQLDCTANGTLQVHENGTSSTAGGPPPIPGTTGSLAPRW